MARKDAFRVARRSPRRRPRPRSQHELAGIGYAGELSLHGLNEPLQNERLFDEYALARRLLPGARLTCYTNGDRLRHEDLGALREVGVDRVRVTLHAAPGQLGRSDSRRLSFFLNRFGIDESRCEVLDDSESVRRSDGGPSPLGLDTLLLGDDPG